MTDSNIDNVRPVAGGTIVTPLGFRAGGITAGIKSGGAPDLGAITCDVRATAAAVYTTNRVFAAPIAVTRASLAATGGKLRGVVVNSGNANACTGAQGELDALAMRATFADAIQAQPEEIAVASTGVIGRPLPLDRIRFGLAELPEWMSSETEDAQQFSSAILTTDLMRKEACVEVDIDGQRVTVAGTAKGSGMIHPNMATMLGFITTDALIDHDTLQMALRAVTDDTFNMITVDGDTSTNDTLLVMASGLAQNSLLDGEHPELPLFIAALRSVCTTLAKLIARDGEGATKLIEVHVQGAQSDADAAIIAKTIVGSSLVKTAVFGADANWGRIIAAIGYAGVPINPNTIDIALGDIMTLEQSVPLAFDETAALHYLQDNETIQIHVNMHDGNAQATAWGCDLTYDYVRINASYRS